MISQNDRGKQMHLFPLCVDNFGWGNPRLSAKIKTYLAPLSNKRPSPTSVLCKSAEYWYNNFSITSKWLLTHSNTANWPSKRDLPCAAGLNRLNWLYYVLLQERQDPSETFEGLAHTYVTKNPIISDHDLEKKIKQASTPSPRALIREFTVF